MRTDTRYAPSERADWETLSKQLAVIEANQALQKAVFTAPEPVLVLNTYRQIVYANAASQTLLCPGQDPATLYACRPGEAMNCIHAEQGAGGCGTSSHCRICGAGNAILNGLRNKVDIQKCSIHTHQQPEPMEFIILSMPLYIREENFALISLFQGQDTQNLANETFAVQRMAAKIENG